MMGTVKAWVAVAVVAGALLAGGCAGSMSDGTMTKDDGMTPQGGMASDKSVTPQKP